MQIAGRAPGDVGGAIEPGQTVAAMVSFSHPAQLKRGLVLKLGRGSSAPPAVLSVLVARAQQANRGRKTLLLSGGGGALQLQRDEGSAYVGVWGLSGQFVYGMNDNWSVDIGLGVLSSGEADIAEIARSERLYRLHGGFRLLFDTWGWIPFARAGAGAAVISERNNGDSSYDGLAFGQVGGGVIRRLGDSFVLGAEGLIEFPLADGGYTFTAHAHLGVSWGGNEF